MNENFKNFSAWAKIYIIIYVIQVYTEIHIFGLKAFDMIQY